MERYAFCIGRKPRRPLLERERLFFRFLPSVGARGFSYVWISSWSWAAFRRRTRTEIGDRRRENAAEAYRLGRVKKSSEKKRKINNNNNYYWTIE